MDLDLIRLVGCITLGYVAMSLFIKFYRIFYTFLLAKAVGDVRNLSSYGSWAGIHNENTINFFGNTKSIYYSSSSQYNIIIIKDTIFGTLFISTGNFLNF